VIDFIAEKHLFLQILTTTPIRTDKKEKKNSNPEGGKK